MKVTKNKLQPVPIIWKFLRKIKIKVARTWNPKKKDEVANYVSFDIP